MFKVPRYNNAAYSDYKNCNSKAAKLNTKIRFTNSASPTRPTKCFINKFSLTDSKAPNKSKIRTSESFEAGPSFKKNKPHVLKQVEIKETNSDIWMETENDSEFLSECAFSNRETPNFEQIGMQTTFIF